MYNGIAYVNRTNNQIPVYKLKSDWTGMTTEKIGTIYPNECYGIHSGEGCPIIAFRNSSGNVELGGVSAPGVVNYPFVEWKSNGSTLSANKKDSKGYYVHTLANNMNWYIGEVKQGVLEVGTQLRIESGETGSKHYYRIACKEAKRPSESSFRELNSGGSFWVDFLTLGSMPYNRSIL